MHWCLRFFDYLLTASSTAAPPKCLAVSLLLGTATNPRCAVPCACLQPGDLLRMEAIILDCLSFRINTPTAHTFLSMYKQALALQPRTCALASYLTVSAS